jgi:hypothetical protein
LAVVNDLLDETGTNVRAFTLYAGGNEGLALLLGPRVPEAMARSGKSRPRDARLLSNFVRTDHRFTRDVVMFGIAAVATAMTRATPVAAIRRDPGSVESPTKISAAAAIVAAMSVGP